ncbi:MAG: hypothetical protein KKB31_06085 [Nanoarchaeota archaeon]|nr:hypothetical protein [Nanoarchaeota archaeon]
MKVIKLKLKDRLKFEKEVHFVKYVFTNPLKLLFKSVKELNNSKNLLFFEFLIFIIVIYRTFIFWLFENFKIVFDKITLFVLFIMALTFVYYVYSSQIFQEDYRKKKEEKLKDAFNNKT